MSSTEQLFAFDNCQIYPLPEGRVLVRNPRTNRQAVLMPDVVSAMRACGQFRSLPEHIERLCKSNPGLQAQQPMLRQVLQSVYDQGLMLRAEELSDTLAPDPQAYAPTDRPVVVVCTWERPESLRRLLDSILANCDLEQIACLHVVDDSRSAQAQAENRATTLEFEARAATAVHYQGEAELAALMQQLIEAVPAHESAIRYLVDRQRWAQEWSTGLARTCGLLLSAGRRVLMMDDDTVCEVYEPYNAGNTPRFGGGAREAAFYASNQEWRGTRAESDTDPFFRHSRFLGATLGQALTGLGQTIFDSGWLKGAPVTTLDDRDASSPVLVTENGSLGDPGTVRSVWFNSLDAASMARLTASEQSVRTAMTVRNNWLGRSHPTFKSQPNMSQIIGLDNRQLMPPYIPTQRIEDRLFGQMMGFVFPDALTLDGNWAIPHLPVPPREVGAGDYSYKAAVSFPTFLFDSLNNNQNQFPDRDPLVRLEHLADQFAVLAEHSHDEIHARHADLRLDLLSERFNLLSANRKAAALAPEYWQAWLDDGLQAVNSEIMRPLDREELTGYPERLEGRELSSWWRDNCAEMASVLRAWPEIRQAAADLVK